MMKSRKLPQPGTGRILIDNRAKEIWGAIENEVGGIDERNWICLSYNGPKELVLDDFGTKGIEEAKMKFRDDAIAFGVMFGVQTRGKNHLDKIRLLYLWIPKSIGPLRKARAILDVDEIVSALDMNFFVLLYGNDLSEMSVEKIQSEVTKFRGGDAVNRGKYYFDDNVFRLRKEILLRNLRAIRKKAPKIEQRVEEFRRKEAHVLRELIQTEQYYVRCMNTLLMKFVHPLLSHGHDKVHAFVLSMVNAIVQVNTDFFETLTKCYDLPPETCESETQFKPAVEQLDERFFTKERISRIVDISLEHFKTFKYYGPYVSHYSKMFNNVTTLLSKDKRLSNHFSKACEELKKSGERNTDFMSYLIMPIQRIPRYQLLFRELLKYTSEKDQNYEKIKNTLEEVKKLANIVNENTDSMIKVLKTIILSKEFKKPVLMSQKLMKSRKIEIVDGKKLMGNKISGKSGEVCVFEKVLLVVEFTSKKKKKKKKKEIGMSGIQSLVEQGGMGDYKMKMHCELLISNPNIRCYRHHQVHEVLDVENESRKISLKFDNSELCEDMVSIIQQQISKYNTHRALSSLYAHRVLFKSLLRAKEPGGGSKIYSHVLCADMKLKLFEKSDNEEEGKMIRSYSLVGANYGKTTLEKSQEKLADEYGGGQKRGSSLFSSLDDSRDSSLFVESFNIFSDSDKPKKKHEKEEEKKNWFFITFRINYRPTKKTQKKKKKKKKKKKSVEEIEGEGEVVEEEEDQKETYYEKKMFFRAQKNQTLKIWLGVLDMLGCCRRIDDLGVIENQEEEKEKGDLEEGKEQSKKDSRSEEEEIKQRISFVDEISKMMEEKKKEKSSDRKLLSKSLVYPESMGVQHARSRTQPASAFLGMKSLPPNFQEVRDKKGPPPPLPPKVKTRKRHASSDNSDRPPLRPVFRGRRGHRGRGGRGSRSRGNLRGRGRGVNRSQTTFY